MPKEHTEWADLHLAFITSAGLTQTQCISPVAVRAVTQASLWINTAAAVAGVASANVTEVIKNSKMLQQEVMIPTEEQASPENVFRQEFRTEAWAKLVNEMYACALHELASQAAMNAHLQSLEELVAGTTSSHTVIVLSLIHI